MAKATLVQEGKVIDYTPSADVAAGDVIVQAELVGVATRPIAANELGGLAVEGIFDFAKPTGSGTDAPVGTNFYWDVADGNAQETADSGTNKLIGKASEKISVSNAGWSEPVFIGHGCGFAIGFGPSSGIAALTIQLGNSPDGDFYEIGEITAVQGQLIVAPDAAHYASYAKFTSDGNVEDIEIFKAT